MTDREEDLMRAAIALQIAVLEHAALSETDTTARPLRVSEMRQCINQMSERLAALIAANRKIAAQPTDK